jgi:hypothetical protein
MSFLREIAKRDKYFSTTFLVKPGSDPLGNFTHPFHTSISNSHFVQIACPHLFYLSAPLHASEEMAGKISVEFAKNPSTIYNISYLSLCTHNLLTIRIIHHHLRRTIFNSDQPCYSFSLAENSLVRTRRRSNILDEDDIETLISSAKSALPKNITYLIISIQESSPLPLMHKRTDLQFLHPEAESKRGGRVTR